MGLTTQIRVVALFRTERRVFRTAKNKQGSDTLPVTVRGNSAHLNQTEGGTEACRLQEEESEHVS